MTGFALVCCRCRSDAVLLTVRTEAGQHWLDLCCAGCGASQRAGPVLVASQPEQKKEVPYG